MELKLGSGQIPVDAHESFNRTFMELKLALSYRLPVPLVVF